MKTSELMTQLMNHLKVHGDREVFVEDTDRAGTKSIVELVQDEDPIVISQVRTAPLDEFARQGMEDAELEERLTIRTDQPMVEVPLNPVCVDCTNGEHHKCRAERVASLPCACSLRTAHMTLEQRLEEEEVDIEDDDQVYSEIRVIFRYLPDHGVEERLSGLMDVYDRDFNHIKQAIERAAKTVTSLGVQIIEVH